MNAITPTGFNLLTGNGPPKPDNGQRIKEAAEQFEGLMMSELLKSARAAGSDGGWMGTGDEDQAGQTSLDMAEQQVANVMAKAGGLGMRNFIMQGLQAK
jgi:Rod binding domain-containing protein